MKKALLLIIMVLACGCVTETSAEEPATAPQPVAEETAADAATAVDETPVNATGTQDNTTEYAIEPVQGPQGKVGKYKGVWLPFYREIAYNANNTGDLVDDGVNIVGIGIELCNDDGSTTKECYGEDYVKHAINAFHSNGIRTYVVLNPAQPRYERRGLDELTPLAFKWARISEGFGVHAFSPSNEPQLVAGEEEVSEWAQEILPRVREEYEGEVWFHVHSDAEGFAEYDLGGYDLVAFSGHICTADITDLPSHLRDVFRDKTKSFEEKYPGKSYVFFDAGAFTGPDHYWWEPIAPENVEENTPGMDPYFFTVTEEEQAKCYELMFNETWGNVQGYFLPAYRGFEYRGKPAESVVREWFNG